MRILGIHREETPPPEHIRAALETAAAAKEATNAAHDVVEEYWKDVADRDAGTAQRLRLASVDAAAKAMTVRHTRRKS